MSRYRVLRLLLSAFLLASCSPLQTVEQRLGRETPDVHTSAPSSSSTRGVDSASAERAFAPVLEAYVRLLQEYVDPLDPTALLAAGWDGFKEALPAPAAVPTLALTGADPAADLRNFRSAYLSAAASLSVGEEGQALLAHATIRKMAESLGDCHTSFTDSQQVQEQIAQAEGRVRLGGVGIRIKRKPDEPTVIWEVLAGGTALKAGVKPGDAILKVDGKDVTKLPLDAVAHLIRGPEGSSVKVTVQRADGKQVKSFTLKRARLADELVASKWLTPNIAYIRLYAFNAASERAFLGALRQAESRHPSAWLLDLRTNSGGDVRVLLSLLSRFLKQGPFGFELNRSRARYAFGPDGNYLPQQHPLAVLVSDSTLSVAELFAASVRYHGAGLIVGSKTAGCAGISNQFTLSDGSSLTVTVNKLLGPDGADLSKKGVPLDADVEVSRVQLAAGQDPQLDRAVALLRAAK